MFHNYLYDMREKKEKIIMSKISGSEIVIECLKEQGVDTVFGYPGGTILNVYDALYKHQDEINHVLTSHEQGAAMQQTDMLELQARSECVWPHQARARPTL